VQHFEENLATLLELALTSWFDPKLVNTERDIIIQEINQYRDNANWVGYQQLLETLYVKYPLRVDIAGTAETVSKITPELLTLCHGTFYHPTNLTLVITGDFEPSELVTLADETANRFAPSTEAPRLERVRPQEPADVTRPRTEKRMTLARPRYLLGFKDLKAREGKELLRAELSTAVALDALFSRESETYERMYNAGIIGGDFGAAFQAEAGFGYAIIGGETKDPVALEKEIKATLEKAREKGIEEEVIERKKKKFLGRYLRNFNDPESTAYSYLSAMGQKSDLFDFPGVLEKVAAKQVNARVREFFDTSRSAASVLLPMG
jgi:predicted Zn-dependent peptidase